jgi:hypothetical protein
MNDIAAGHAARPGDGTMAAWLAPILAARGTTLDAAQVAARDRLQELALALQAFRAARQSTLTKIFAPPEVPRGVYLWGGVGRGKSFLMDGFFATVAIRRKSRVHFHAFMRDVHADLASLKQEPDPLATVAARIARRWRLICFDEFHVSDIADAMILGRLLEALFGHGVVFVMTTNYSPDVLWPNGLQRERFLPTIALLKQWLDVVEVAAGGPGPTTCRSARERTPRWARRSSRCGPGRMRIRSSQSRAGRSWRAGARAASPGSISRRCATARGRSATISSWPAAFRSCFYPASRG